jgi:hypothetical protein
MRSKQTRMHSRKVNSERRKTISKKTNFSVKSCHSDSKIKKSVIVENFIELLNMVKIYHWNTKSFAQHKATDELHQRLSEHVDKFVEILLGKKEDRLNHLRSKISLVNAKQTHSFRDKIYQYREYLIGMDKCFDKDRDTDLLNIRDELLGDVNQFLYLLTLQ